MPRSLVYKKCLWCGKPFVCNTKTARKTYCSIQCGIRSHSRKYKVDVEKLRELVDSDVNLLQICDILHETYHVVRRVMCENGIKYKRKYKRRSDGYWGYTTDKNHRKIIENFIGRKLLSSERVHHIDGDKQNNDISNLCLLSSEREHAVLHKQLESIAFQLLKQGFISFDPETKQYKPTI